VFTNDKPILALRVSGAQTLYKQARFVTTSLPFFPFILILYSPFVMRHHMDLI
jgi:hypothetical protein